MKFMQNMRVFQKVVFLGITIILTFTLLLALYIYPTFQNSMYNAKEEQTSHMVESAASSIQHFVDLQKDGQMTLEEAQAGAMDAVRYMRYDNDNYFWINDLSPKMIMHPVYSSEDKPEWYQDKGLTDYVDPTGKHIFVEFAAIAKEFGEGRLDYEWTKPGEENKPPAPKISYVKLIPEWGWVVGTGIYVDDVKAQINQTTTVALLVILVIIGLSILIAITLANSIARPLRKITTVAEHLAEGDISEDVTMNRKDEVGLLANAFKQIIQYQRQMSDVADRLADGDLTAEIHAKSAKDSLGNSFERMLASLRETVRMVAQNALSLDQAADQLSMASTQAADATNQITTTIQQIALGSTDQAEAINKTANAVEQMSQAINGVAKGAQEQSSSVFKVSNATDQINRAIQQVAGNAAAVSTDSDTAAEAARKGSVTIEQTLSGMNSIKEKVGVSSDKVEEMGRRSEEIGKIIETNEPVGAQRCHRSRSRR